VNILDKPEDLMSSLCLDIYVGGAAQNVCVSLHNVVNAMVNACATGCSSICGCLIQGN